MEYSLRLIGNGEIKGLFYKVYFLGFQLGMEYLGLIAKGES